MKNYTQVYVKNSLEAAKTYCKAFSAEITLEMKNVACSHEKPPSLCVVYYKM